MGQLLGAFGLLDFTMFRPVLAWGAFWNLWTIYFFNFQFFFSCPGKPRILNQWIRGQDCSVSLEPHYNTVKAKPCITKYRPVVHVSYGIMYKVRILVRSKPIAVGRRGFSSGETSGERDCFVYLVKCELTSVECRRRICLFLLWNISV
jgi:hypothetical protein